MRESGCSLAEILLAGQWQSAAFATYMDEVALQKVHNIVLHNAQRIIFFMQDVAFNVAVDCDDGEESD